MFYTFTGLIHWSVKPFAALRANGFGGQQLRGQTASGAQYAALLHRAKSHSVNMCLPPL